VTLKDQGHDPDTFEALYLDNRQPATMVQITCSIEHILVWWIKCRLV